MKIFVINLQRRPDRLEFMDAQLTALNLRFLRIDAVDGSSGGDIGYPEKHPRLSKPEFACYQSHRKSWDAFLETGEAYCLVLEDDVKLAKSLPRILERTELFDHDRGVTKLEGSDRQVWAKEKPVNKFDRFALYRVTSFVGGAGAYILTRKYAKFLTKTHATPHLPVDDTIYAQSQKTSGRSNIVQLLPAPAMQLVFLNKSQNTHIGMSDLETPRVKNGIVLSDELHFQKKIMREMTRPFRQLSERIGSKKIALKFDGDKAAP